MGARQKGQPYGRIKQKYNPKRNAREQRHWEWVSEQPCMGCGSQSGPPHHPLMESPDQRWRRDHEFIVPICPPCHTEIHDEFGNEEKWAESKGWQLPVRVAEAYRKESQTLGILISDNG